MVGRTIGIDRPLTQLGNGPAPISYALDKNAATVRINILDQQGHTVRTLDYLDRPAGQNLTEWDGKDQNGTRMPAGIYQYALSAVDTKGASVATQSHAQLTVSGVRMVEGKAKLLVGDLTVEPTEIVELR